jgi:Predicted RNA-binding protein containing a PIN domain
MSYLVDGNNVMGQRVGWHKDKPGARRGLLEELARFAFVKRVSVSVVFDGKPEKHFADGSSYKGVKVFYAERGSNADERIKRFVDEARERRTLFVVTSDRELASYVRQCGVQVIRSGDFRKRLAEAAADNSSLPDEEPKVNQKDVPEWMRYFGVGPEDDEEDSDEW